jgi:hypothetical protein
MSDSIFVKEVICQTTDKCIMLKFLVHILVHVCSNQVIRGTTTWLHINNKHMDSIIVYNRHMNTLAYETHTHCFKST